MFKVANVVKHHNAKYRERIKPAKKGQKMKPAEYFEAANAALNIRPDYELAKRLGTNNGKVPSMGNGTRAVPLDMAYKLAITPFGANIRAARAGRKTAAGAA